MSENTLFKKSYTRQEIEECFQWLEQHIDSLPTSMRLSPSINIPDVRHTVTPSIFKLRHQMGAKTIYSGQFSILCMIREKAAAAMEKDNQA